MVLSQGNIINCRCLFHRLMWVLWHLVPLNSIDLSCPKVSQHQSYKTFPLPFYIYPHINFKQFSVSANTILKRVSDRFIIKQTFAIKSVFNNILSIEYWLMHNNYVFPRIVYKRFTGRLHLNNDYLSAHISAVQ